MAQRAVGLRKEPKKPSRLFWKPRETQKNLDNDNEYDNDNEKDKENIKRIVQIQFQEFWQAYPKKVDKKNCLKWFEKNKPDEELFTKMMEKLYQYTQSEQWTKDDGRFIPHPKTWLNQERWEDEVEPTQTKLRGEYKDGIFYL